MKQLINAKVNLFVTSNQLSWNNNCFNKVRRNSCYGEAGRNSCNDEAGLNSCYNKAGRIGIFLRILLYADVFILGLALFLRLSFYKVSSSFSRSSSFFLDVLNIEVFFIFSFKFLKSFSKIVNFHRTEGCCTKTFCQNPIDSIKHSIAMLYNAWWRCRVLSDTHTTENQHSGRPCSMSSACKNSPLIFFPVQCSDGPVPH